MGNCCNSRRADAAQRNTQILDNIRQEERVSPKELLLDDIYDHIRMAYEQYLDLEFSKKFPKNFQFYTLLKFL